MDVTLYWITQDLRLDDNPALTRAAQSDALICAFCIDQHWFSPHRYHVSSMGMHRWQFLQQSLVSLSEALAALNQHLHLEYGYPELQLAALIAKHKVTRLVCSRQFGSDEQKIINYLAGCFPQLEIEQTDATTLFDKDQVPAAPHHLLKGFTPFREQMEPLPVPQPLQAPMSLPRPMLRVVGMTSHPDWIPDRYTRLQHNGGTGPLFAGGETAAHHHLTSYFATDLPLHYKRVRDQLDGWENSSKLSPWLNTGCLSVRRVKQVLSQFEHSHGASESTIWLYFELLWREYFQWLALAQGNRLFSLRGLAAKAPHACLHPERYQKWCHGNTPWPIVNACMRQLKLTGYLSNRGRQIAASCFVNELGMDWRYGAAWFEHQLTDYNVASNWGNWQYIAGVGVDPRGGRHFNLEKQTHTFDPDGRFVADWAPDKPETRLDSVDAADWPIS